MSDRNMRPDRSATGTVRRAAIDYAANAARALRSSRPSDADVHQARKAIKKSRAALRLLRAALAEATYRRDDAALRRAAHALNAARDARVLLRTLDSVRRRHVAFGQDKAAAALSRMLHRRQAHAQLQLHAQPEPLALARLALRQVQLRARRWRIGQHGWKRLGVGFKRIYRAGRRAARAAHRRPDALMLHQWRKQVQYLWYALQILKPLQSKAPSKLAGLARRLADYLGEAHDLALLQSSVVAFGRRHEPVGEALPAAIERRRAALRLKAMAVGKRLYALRPRAMAAHVGRCCAPTVRY
jgi:CHAD domain-containing protein